MEINKRENIGWIDLLRVTACFLVVFAHCCDPFVARFDTDRPTFLQGCALGSAVRCCVPLFVMMTGVLLFPVRNGMSEFYKKRIGRIVVPLIFWSVMLPVLYFIYLNYITTTDNPTIDMSAFTLEMTITKIWTFIFNFNYDTTPLWYLYMLVGLYFSGEMAVDASHPDWEERDRFILSKGHVAPVLYSVLARRGYFDPALLPTLRQLGSPLQGHPHMAKLPGLDCSSGSLGQGLSIANGLALAARRTGRTYRTYCLLGDGELQEGQVWEAAMTAAHFALDTVCAIVDDNGVQLDGPTCEVMNVAPLADKFRAFGWQVLSVDGHSLDALAEAFRQAATRGRPTVLLARTVKGKGVSFMEGQPAWHGKAPNDQELAAALAELAEGGTL